MVKRKGGKKKAVVAEGPQIKKTKVEDVVRVGEFIKTRRYLVRSSSVSYFFDFWKLLWNLL